MLFFVVIFLLFSTPIHISDCRSGYATKYLNTNYIPLIIETTPMTSTQVSSKLICLMTCLNENDCSLAVFNKTNNQCYLYNLFPLVEQELLPDDDIIVFTVQQTIQLSSLVSNTDWLISRLNTTNLINVLSVPYARSVTMDIFGYLLTLETSSETTYVNRYDRTTSMLVKRTALSISYTNLAILTYYNKMIFIGGPNNVVFIFDHVNFTLLATITCGSNLDQPRNLIFMESENLMIIASYDNAKIVFFRINSPTNYTCLNSTTLNGGPQALLKINDNFFYAVTYNSISIYSYQFNGQTWISSLFINVSQAIGVSSARVANMHVDNLQRRWVMLPYFGLAIFDQSGMLLGKWKVGRDPFDIFISDDYRIVIAENGNSTLSFYDPQVRI